MPKTISDLWLLTYHGRPVDIREPLFSSRQIEPEIQRANKERRNGPTDWTAIDLDEVIHGDGPLPRACLKVNAVRNISVLRRRQLQVVSSNG